MLLCFHSPTHALSLSLSSSEDMARTYALLGRYLGNLADSIGQLVMMMNRLAGIAGYTARVHELLDKVHRLNSVPLEPFKERDEESKGISQADQANNELLRDIEPWLVTWRAKCDREREVRSLQHTESVVRQIPGGGGKFVVGEGNIMQFDHVDIVSPEGRLLVRDLNFKVDTENVMVTGPNGAGKSSLFRIISELWPLSKGTVTKPTHEDILFVPQKPYLVAGTFRDQIIYPHDHARMKQRGITDDDLYRFLAIVDPSNKMASVSRDDTTPHLLLGCSHLSAVVENGRLCGLVHGFFWRPEAARGHGSPLLCERGREGKGGSVSHPLAFQHRPKYAVLDESTSACSSEVEDELYSTCAKIGITLFTGESAHRGGCRCQCVWSHTRLLASVASRVSEAPPLQGAHLCRRAGRVAVAGYYRRRKVAHCQRVPPVDPGAAQVKVPLPPFIFLRVGHEGSRVAVARGPLGGDCCTNWRKLS